MQNEDIFFKRNEKEMLEMHNSYPQKKKKKFFCKNTSTCLAINRINFIT